MLADPPSSSFHTTRWSLILEAQGEGQSARSALENLCSAYWFPLYAFVRRQGRSHHDAQDLTQAFLMRFLVENNRLKFVDRKRGKLRSYLLQSLKNFITNDWERSAAKKRGGTLEHLPFETGDRRFESIKIERNTPESLYDYCWSMSLLDRAKTRLKALYAADGREAYYDALSPYLTLTHNHQSYAATAEKGTLFSDATAVRKAAHRFRMRFGQFLREEIERTVASSSDADEEIRALFAAFDQFG